MSLSNEGFAKILMSVDNIRHKAILMPIYFAVLSVEEVMRECGCILKADKDRYMMFSDLALELYRGY